MDWLDANILLFLNQFVNRWPWFDSMMRWASGTHLMKGAAVLLFVWYVLFDREEEAQRTEPDELLVGVTLLSPVAVLVARALALCLPFRTRPFATPALHLRLPSHVDPSLPGWSSFPSDHAVLFFMLATGILFASRPVGWLAIGWVAAVISFPRLYLGIHWPTDLLAGAVLGVGFAHLAKISVVRYNVKRFTRWYRERPGLFFAVLFLLSFQIATLFQDSRRLASGVWRLLQP